ncbi:MAG TPA: MarR family transcriptional regulator [Amnibacterium sp.]|nr:MarR family transcriptional regulator [Amnibacterium sp.]
MVDQDRLRDEIGEAVLRFIAGAVLHNQAVAARVGIGASDGQVLSLLTVDGPMTAGRIATVTGLSTGSVTALLDRLERGSYIRRERDPNDRRKVLVVPAIEGRQRLAAHYEDYGTHMRAVLDERTPEELQAIAAFLKDMNDVDGYVGRAPRTDDR